LADSIAIDAIRARTARYEATSPQGRRILGERIFASSVARKSVNRNRGCLVFSQWRAGP